MIPLFTREEARALDADASQRLGLPSVVLMENAGRGVFEALRAEWGAQLAKVAIVGGVGQNGGDGWVLARHLIQSGLSPRCVLIGERAKVRGDAEINLRALERLGVAVPALSDLQLLAADGSALTAALAGATLIVDGLFGTGLDRPVSGLYARVIELLNAADAPRVALDIPSGVDANSGAVLGCAVAAHHTITFAGHKRGLHQHPGARLAGRVSCASIGVPVPASAHWQQLEAADVGAWLSPRSADAHKGTGKHVLVIAGAPGRTGAALLAGLGALRGGAGLVTLMPRAGARAALDAKVIELMTADMPDTLDAAVRAVDAELVNKQVAVIGPGLGTDDAARALIRRLALELPQPCVLDADALTAFAGDARELQKARGPRVLTPHPAEAARVLGVHTAEVQADRYAAASRLASDTGQYVVLKGARSVIARPEGSGCVCPLDVPALAVGGTGDVLSGVVGAVLGALPAFEAAAAAVYLHARAGQLAARSDRGLLAREVADALPLALEACRHELTN